MHLSSLQHVVALSLLWLASSVSGNSYGAPYAACDSMTPQHDGVSATPGNGGFRIDHNMRNGYIPDRLYNVTITGTVPFLGFFCRGQFQNTYAHRDAAGYVDGRYIPRGTRLSPCPPSPKAALTHIRRMNLNRMWFGFRAPNSNKPFYLRCTFVQQKHRFFVNVTSNLICRNNGQRQYVCPPRPGPQPGPPGPGGQVGQCSCPRGPPGPQGQKGERGSPGPRGSTGWSGSNGRNGQKGEKGESGAVPGQKGQKGEKGFQGGLGEKGQRGERGRPGPRGDQGPKGFKGSHGAFGQKGAKGARGYPGPSSPGQRGLRGDQGPPGPIGPQGPPGPPGGAGLGQVDISRVRSQFDQEVAGLNSRLQDLEEKLSGAQLPSNSVWYTNLASEVSKINAQNEIFKRDNTYLKDQVEILQNTLNARTAPQPGSQTILKDWCCSCQDPLGISNGSIEASRFSASSHIATMEAHKARLNGPAAWVPSSFMGAWIEVDLKQVFTITEIRTKGMPGGSLFIKTYRVQYKASRSATWTEHPQICQGNSDTTSTATCQLNCVPPLVRARFVRLVVISYSSFPALQFEVYGCDRQ